jgi:hypothetical protein
MTLSELERNLVATLSLGLIAGREDPDRWGSLGGNCLMLLNELEKSGGLERFLLNAWCEEQKRKGKGG